MQSSSFRHDSACEANIEGLGMQRVENDKGRVALRLVRATPVEIVASKEDALAVCNLFIAPCIGKYVQHAGIRA